LTLFTLVKTVTIRYAPLDEQTTHVVVPTTESSKPWEALALWQLKRKLQRADTVYLATDVNNEAAVTLARSYRPDARFLMIPDEFREVARQKHIPLSSLELATVLDQAITQRQEDRYDTPIGDARLISAYTDLPWTVPENTSIVKKQAERALSRVIAHSIEHRDVKEVKAALSQTLELGSIEYMIARVKEQPEKGTTIIAGPPETRTKWSALWNAPRYIMPGWCARYDELSEECQNIADMLIDIKYEF
jgi:hypothetical protein